MINNKKIIGLILARGGSKGLPNKNIKIINEYPLIYWTIKAAKESKYIDDIVLSTDSTKIIKTSERFGVEVPFIRPSSLADDNSKSSDCIVHALEKLESMGRYYSYVILLEPTSPLREAKDIDESIELLDNSEYQSIVGVTETESYNPSFLYKIVNNNLIPLTGKHPSDLRRQDIEKIFSLEGSIYI